VLRHPRIIRSTLACLVPAIFFGSIAGGCGGATGPGSGAEGQKVPLGIEKLKESMKEQMAAKKGRPGGPIGLPKPR
jgi:hypothetical protein